VHVRRLPLHVDRAHVHDAGESQTRTRGGRRDTVLARARLGDDAASAEPLREHGLADRVVDLVRARVREILALQPHVCIPRSAQSHRVRERRRAPDPLRQLAREIALEGGVGQDLRTPRASRSSAGTSISGT
jgi:hypothetical protein